MVVRVRRVVVPVLLLMLALPLSVTAQQSSNPPRDLHRVDDHWTAWYPPDPATYPAGTQVHTISGGETLWGLASRYYGSPYLWPQLWEANTYIKDSHWIYPGDPLQVPGEAMQAMGAATSVSADTGFPEMAMDEAAPVMQTDLEALGSPIPLGTESDLYCWGYLGAVNEPMPNAVVGFEDSEVKYMPMAERQDTGVATLEIIFLKGGTATGLIPGETYLVVKPGELIEHPVTEEVVGRHYDFRGQVRILCASEYESTAIVTQACSDIHIGDRIQPMRQIPIPLARVSALPSVCTPTGGKASGYIVNAKDYHYALGEGMLVELNLGRNHFVQPGDFLTVYRDNPTSGAVPQLLGEVAILTADANTSTARILQMRYHMQVGDRVEQK